MAGMYQIVGNDGLRGQLEADRFTLEGDYAVFRLGNRIVGAFCLPQSVRLVSEPEPTLVQRLKAALIQSQ